MKSRLRYEELFPDEIEEIVHERPIAYLPLGTLEWHSYHLPLGFDAIKAHELCIRVAERVGGVVMPPTYWAIGGMPHPWTMRFDQPLIERLFYSIYEQLAHVGFRVVVALTGHYSTLQYYTVKKAARDLMLRSNLTIAPLPEYEVVYGEGYRGDHAAKWETSILWELRPELVDMSRLSSNLKEPLEGVLGEDPRVHASRELGKRIVDQIVERLSELSIRLLKMGPLDRSRFIQALSLQVDLLERVKALPRWERRRILDADGYIRFLECLWSLNLPDALKVGEELIKEVGK